MQQISIDKISSDTIIKTACEILSQGGLIIFPTETTYGAGVDATNQEAVNKLLAYKSRREGKPLSIVVTDQEMAERFVVLNEQATALWRQFLPGPVTVVCASKNTVAEGVASEFGTLGLRVPDYPLIIDIVRQYGKPMTATSANGSGGKTPYSINDIMVDLSTKQHSLIDLVIDAGTLPKNPPSVVIDTTLSAPVTLRTGSIAELNKHEKAQLLVSQSEVETKNIAQRVALANWSKVQTKSLVFALTGPLGVGKTIFAKGIAQFLQISEPITSPTYSYIEEYTFQRHQTSGMFYHLDMWKVDSQAAFERLELASLVQPNTVFVIEWFDQISPYISAELREKMHIVPLVFTQEREQRKIQL